MSTEVATTQPRTEVDRIRGSLDKMRQDFVSALPAQIPTDRFVRTALTAIQLNPDLQAADRKSLLGAVMKAAQDGLLPDGREGALVTYKTKVRITNETGGTREEWRDMVQWMPMVAGLMKKARNSGEIVSLNAHVVYSKDRFHVLLGDEEKIEHEPSLEAERGEALGAYAIATLKDGSKIRTWLPKGKVELAKSVSKAANGPMWTKFWEEAWRKTAIRHLCKMLPASTDRDGVDAFVRTAERDDETYDFNDRAAAARDVTTATRPSLDDFAREQERREPRQAPPAAEVDADTGEILDEASSGPQGEAEAEPATFTLVIPGSAGKPLVLDNYAAAAKLVHDKARQAPTAAYIRALVNANGWLAEDDALEIEALADARDGAQRELV